MKMIRRRTALLFASAATLAAFQTGVSAQPSRNLPIESLSVPDENSVADAYFYLLARALVIRQEHMDRSAPGFAYYVIKQKCLAG